MDGNKRTALVVSEGFLRLNGYRIVSPPGEKYYAYVNLAAGSVAEEQLAAWFETHAVRF